MGGNLDLRELFFSATGRCARPLFWVATVVLLAIFGFYEAVDSATLHWVTGWFVYPALIYPAVCVLSKRLHDRGRSGWFAALVIAAIIAVTSSPFSFFDLAWNLVLLWAVVELGLMPGEQGANRFGVNPLAA